MLRYLIIPIPTFIYLFICELSYKVLIYIPYFFGTCAAYLFFPSLVFKSNALYFLGILFFKIRIQISDNKIQVVSKANAISSVNNLLSIFSHRISKRRNVTLGNRVKIHCFTYSANQIVLIMFLSCTIDYKVDVFDRKCSQKMCTLFRHISE